MPALSQNFIFTTGNPPGKSTSITFPAGHKGETLTYTSEALKGDGYYGGDGFHTVTYIPWAEQPRNPFVYNNFRGSVIIQATLELEPTEEDWFNLSETETVFDSTYHSNTFHNFRGNYTWIRAKVTISEGVLTQILYNH
jgi:hypothetical protein